MGIIDLFRKKSKMYLYPDKATEQFEAFIAEQYGDIGEVMHEIVSSDIHLDILVVPPTDKNPYYKLITMGMGAYKMNVPAELQEYELERAELVLFLPPTWNIKSGNKEDYWPIEQLKILARLPVQQDCWLGLLHSVSSDRDNSPYADNTKFCSMILLLAGNQDHRVLDLRIKGLGKINFYQLLPLYKEEVEYAMANGAKELLDRFDIKDIFPVLNNNRRNYAIE